MLQLKTPRGLSVQVPESASEDPSPRFPVTATDELRSYYQENGYVVVNGVFPSTDCDAIRQLWESEVKPDRGFMYRQATARAERHVVNEQKWIMNPILNLQSVDPRRFPAFRAFAAERILTAPGLRACFSAILNERPRIVQSMYFEGNSATWEHQDSYYLDSEQVGSMVAAWIALEDIEPEAGRFFICPKSHKIEHDQHDIANNIAENHEQYIQSIVAKVRSMGLEIRAPRLRKGDVLFWNALTIHGSLDSQDATHSRSSITCHAIAESHRFLQLQSRILDMPTERLNDVLLCRPKDLASRRNRAIFFAECRFPKAFYRLKKEAIKFVVGRRATAILKPVV